MGTVRSLVKELGFLTVRSNEEGFSSELNHVSQPLNLGTNSETDKPLSFLCPKNVDFGQKVTHPPTPGSSRAFRELKMEKLILE